MHTVMADAAHSRFVQRIRRRHAAELALLPPGAPDAAAITALVGRLQAAGRGIARRGGSPLRSTARHETDRQSPANPRCSHADLHDSTLSSATRRDQANLPPLARSVAPRSRGASMVRAART
jgi:hypothetical protein